MTLYKEILLNNLGKNIDGGLYPTTCPILCERYTISDWLKNIKSSSLSYHKNYSLEELYMAVGLCMILFWLSTAHTLHRTQYNQNLPIDKLDKDQPSDVSTIN